MMSGNTPWVDSENINKYVKKYIREVKFEDVKLAEDVDSQQDGDIICQTQAELDAALVQKCEEMYAAGADLPAVTIKVNMIDLEHTEQYKDFTGLVKVSLGDTVHCYNSKLGIATDARVISLKWDCIRNQANEMTLGDYEYNYFKDMTSTLQAVSQILGPGNTVVADKVSGVLNAINTQLRYQKNIAQKEDTDPESPTYGAMCLGTQGFQIADSRTEDDRDWDWKTAFTAKGGYADVIIAGYMLADRIHGGTLTLGGSGNGNGVCRVLDADGGEAARLDVNGLKTNSAQITGGSIDIQTDSSSRSVVVITYNSSTWKRLVSIKPEGIKLIEWQSGWSQNRMVSLAGGSVLLGLTSDFSADAVFDSVNASIQAQDGSASFSGSISAGSLGAGDGYSGGIITGNGQSITVRGGIITNVT